MVVLAAVAAAVLALEGRGAEPASAASCSLNNISDYAKPTLRIQGEGLCSDHAEAFKVYCSAGTVMVDYAFIDTNDLSGTHDTGALCGEVQSVTVDGLGGADRIEMTNVGTSRTINGGDGGDTVLVRNGARDNVDCGADVDSIQADQHSVDSAANCEISDFLPEATAPTKAKKKCKKRRHHHRCRKHNKH